MKKIIPIILLAAALLSVTACSRGQEASVPVETPTPSPSNDDMAILAASDTDAAAAVQSHVPPASNTDLEVDGAAYESAMGCIGKTIFDLYAVIGQPQQTPVYTAVADQEDAREGTLPYKGFVVMTLRTEEEEIVRSVVLNSERDEQVADQPAEQAALPADASVQPTEVPAAG